MNCASMMLTEQLYIRYGLVVIVALSIDIEVRDINFETLMLGRWTERFYRGS